MSLYDTIRGTMVPIHREGYRFIAAFFGAALILGLLWTPLFWIGLILTAWCAYFFRDPERVTPVDEDLAISPADGRVSSVGKVVPLASVSRIDAADNYVMLQTGDGEFLLREVDMVRVIGRTQSVRIYELLAKPGAPIPPEQEKALRSYAAGLEAYRQQVWDEAVPGWNRYWWQRWLGWLLTALAISIGAPFWFDLLNRLVNVRHGVRRPEPEKPASP